MSHTENIVVHVNVGDGTNRVEVFDLIFGKEAFESLPGSQAYTALRKGWEPRFNSTCPPFFPSGFPCLASGVGWYLTHCFNAFVETQFSGWRYSLIFPIEREKWSHFYVESDGSEARRKIFHYLPGAAESSCVPVCLCSWCSPSCTVSGPGPGSLFGGIQKRCISSQQVLDICVSLLHHIQWSVSVPILLGGVCSMLKEIRTLSADPQRSLKADLAQFKNHI